ncbi:hypothetical protein P9D43_16575 [Neobacillus niacini]|uniref:hypothetical protein n=2 Tax=Neobacillus niacini TaxID=86668 RepID=UPI0007AB2C03|nr:hypothetical protein [Neobacillus niacini]MEC1523621.1 hypothetical protein [Neobacillus niacini]
MKGIGMWGILLVCVLLTGCNSNSEQTKGEPKKEQTPPSEPNKNKQVEEPEVKKGTPEWDMLQIEQAVENNDEAVFMSYQNSENHLFFKEQKRWIEEAKFKKEQGYTLSVDISFMKENDTKGKVYFRVKMSHPNFESTNNLVIYQAIKVNEKWILNDVPFETLTSESGSITVYYKKGQEDTAQKTLKDATDIVAFYSKMFNWKPEPISIKVYSNINEVSATVPWVMLSGWNEIGESLKINSGVMSQIFKYLAHELTHKMVGDITNDNASIYIQEGFATYLQAAINRDGNGMVSFDPQKPIENAQKAMEISNTLKTIEELGQIDYTDPEGSMYRDGALLSTYLIETKGINIFFDMLKSLSAFEYIDKRIEHKLEMVNSRTVEAIEKVYGPDEQVSADLKNYYLK